MSTWIVNRDHIDLLLTAAVAWGLTDVAHADEVGRLLWRENLASVVFSYPASRDGQRPGPEGFHDRDVETYCYRPYPGRVDPEVVVTAADSLSNQSGAHPGWTSSAAHRWVTRLNEQAFARIPAYLAEHGPVDPNRQPHGQRSWYVPMATNGQRHTYIGDGWGVPDRDVFVRAAAVRTGPSRPPGAGPAPGQQPH